MKLGYIWMGLLTGVLLGIPWLALGYFAWQSAGIAFPPFTLFDWFTRVLPGGFITAGVDGMVGALQAFRVGNTSAIAKFAEGTAAIFIALGVTAVLGAVCGYAADTVRRSLWVCGILFGIAFFIAFLPASISLGRSVGELFVTLVLCLAWGIALCWFVTTSFALDQTPATQAISRRDLTLGFGLGIAALTVGGLGLGTLLRRAPASEAVGTAPISSPPPPATPPTAFDIVSGTRTELTPLENFYRVDINAVPPEVDVAQWKLNVGGLVSSPMSLTYTDVKQLPTEDFYATLECISNTVGGDLTSTTWFTGIPLHELLTRAGLDPNALEIKFTSHDGYSESLPRESALDPATHLCIGMGGQPLETKHGFPMRLYTPDRYGMKNPKWITGIEAIGEPYTGYWEQRGWGKPALVKTTSVIDTPLSASADRSRAGGIAFAGARGINQVEVQVDDGAWQPAKLKPPLSGLTWVIWAIDLALGTGSHRLTVRATDGTGALQIQEPAPQIPDGAAGYHQVNI